MSSWGAEETARAVARALETSGAPCVGAAAATVGSAAHAVVTVPAGHEASRVEIGSITKTMTATVLAWLVVGGEVDAGAPIGTWLDVSGTPGAAITLEQLATHTSGLPRLAPNAFTHDGFDDDDPYAAFGAEEAEEGLRAVEALDSPGTRAYSNFGFQLLGVCLERVTDRPLGELFRTVLFEPLGMPTAAVSVGRDHDDALLPATRNGVPAPPWHLLLPGPGGVLASLDDLLRYGLAVASPPEGRLGEAIRHATTAELGWATRPGGVLWHNGGTAGCRSMLAIAPSDGRAVAAFVNDGAFDPVDAATLAGLHGQDPMGVVPTPLDPSEASPWTDSATTLAAALHGADFATVRAAMTDAVAAALTVERLEAGHAGAIEPHLPLSAPVVSSVHRVGDGVQVRMLATSASGELVTIVTFDADRRVIGLQLA